MKYLTKFNTKPITIKQNGFVSSRLSIESLKYNLEYDILTLEDSNNSNYMYFNLNQVYKIEEQENKIIFFLDNDTQIEIN